MSSPPNAASAHSPPPHVNDFYEKRMMLDSPPKGKRGGREGRERERKGGRVRKRRGCWLRAREAKVGVVFPVNTELQLVRGEGSAEKQQLED